MLNSALTPESSGPFQGNAMSVRPIRSALLGAAMLSFSAPALADHHPMPAPQPGVVDASGKVYDGPMPDNRPQWRGAPPPMAQHMGQPMSHPGPGYDEAAWQQARADWLAECRSRHGNGNKVGGAVVGAVVGGVVGNRVAGRGNRTVGTVAGATVGAVAGGAIGSSADKRAARDYCEAYLERNTSWGYGHGQAHGQGVVGYGYAPMTVMVPVAYVQVATAAPAQQRECKETIVTEEWVAVPGRTRYITVHPKPLPDKRVRIVPDKRVRVN
jgi:hypothetical protein